MAEALLRHRLGSVDESVRVSSAGAFPGGQPATGHGQATMAARGLDLSTHVSRRLERHHVDGADLIIGMARTHVREAVSLVPDALARTYTLKELVRAARSAGKRRSSESMADWLARVGNGRRRTDLAGVGHDDAFDIEDPIGRDRSAYEVTADEIDALLADLVALAWPEGHRSQERSA